MNSWMEVVNHWKHGVIYPAWAGLAHYGYGEARFIFYPPISWTLGAILGTLLPWPVVPAAYIWIALTFSGCTMFLLSRTWLNRNDALFAAALYAANPYYLVIVYWRSAFAELLAGALLPLVAMFVWRSREHRRVVVPLALIVCAAWLTNIPAAVMVTYSLGLLALTLAISRRSQRVVIDSVLAIALGAALAGFYLLPAIYEQKWINIEQVLAPGVRPDDNFLFTTIGDIDHNRFNLLVSLIAISEIAVLTAALFRKGKIPKPMWWCLVLWSLMSAVIMSRFTLPAWRHFPELRFVQFPWRWLLCLNVPFALFVAIAWRRWPQQIIVCAVMLGVIAFVWHRVQSPWWDAAPDIAEMLDDQQTGQGYEGTDEYVPAGADAYEISQSAPLVAEENASGGQIQIQQWTSESKQFTTVKPAPSGLHLRLFNYPAWEVQIDGEPFLATADNTGQMIIFVPAGRSSVKITFSRTWDRTAGMLVSVLTVLMVLLFGIHQRRRRPASVKTA